MAISSNTTVIPQSNTGYRFSPRRPCGFQGPLLSSTPAHAIRAAGGSQLKALATKYPRRIKIVKYFAGDKEGNDAIAKEMKGKYGRVHTTIANAGIAHYMGKAHETFVDKLR
ncbi:hypothetical protein BJ912DRAFT_1057775 [Pholiota molesta]|nr:hypothetical protein BJ912DRAFT_1057775 [Pholiota molesta]